MKKIILLFLTAVALFTSCEVTTRETVEPFTYTRTYRVNWADWELGEDATGIYYYRTFRDSNLSRIVFDRGIMQAFMYYRIDSRDTMSPLPFSDFIVDKNGYKREEHFTVEWQIGLITFILKIDDKTNIDEHPEVPFYDSYEFLVRFLW